MPKPAFDSLIFDLDGTLWDSTQPVTHAWNRALEALGFRRAGLTEEEIAGIMGLSHDKIFAKIFPETSEAERERIAEECYRHEIETLKKEGAALYPGVMEGLPALAKKFPLFLVSNCQASYMDAFFECTGFRKLFKDWECFGNTRQPKGDNIRAVVQRNKLKSTAYIGDTAGDHLAAEKAGVPYFHMGYGFGSPHRDCLIFDSFPDLVVFFSHD